MVEYRQQQKVPWSIVMNKPIRRCSLCTDITFVVQNQLYTSIPVNFSHPHLWPQQGHSWPWSLRKAWWDDTTVVIKMLKLRLRRIKTRLHKEGWESMIPSSVLCNSVNVSGKLHTACLTFKQANHCKDIILPNSILFHLFTILSVWPITHLNRVLRNNHIKMCHSIKTESFWHILAFNHPS